MIQRLLMFGASGDLAGRYLLPALANLYAAGKLPGNFRVTGTSREDWDDDAFQRHASGRLEHHAADVPIGIRDGLARMLRYRYSNVSDAESITAIVRELTAASDVPIAVYLALPQGLYATAVTILGAAGLPDGSRIVVEKPFGENMDGARELNALLAEVTGDAGERAVFRVDHALGMSTVQNLIGLRAANPILEAVWNSTHIEQIDILWEETLALEGRAGFYDKAGALKDVMQNHMMQVLCLIAMEPATSLDDLALRDRKVDLLRAIRTLTPGEIMSHTRRARYIAGTVDGRILPAYAGEAGVDPSRGTETFAEVELEIDNERWAGTRFLMRTAKALAENRICAIVRFRPVANSSFGEGTANVLRIGFDDPVDIVLNLTGNTADPPSEAVPVILSGPPPASDLPAYSHVLLDILSGGSTLSVRGDEAEEAWRIMDPILHAWANDLVPLEEYPAGATGLPPRNA